MNSIENNSMASFDAMFLREAAREVEDGECANGSWKEIKDSNYASNAFLRYQKLEKDHAELFATNVISFTKNWFNNVIDVDQDSVKVIEADAKQMVGTSGVATCIAVCALGKTLKDKLITGIAHFSSIVPSEGGLEKVQNEMIKGGAVKNTIQMYLVGGQLINLKSREDDPGTIEDEEALLKLKKKFSIKGAILHRNFNNDQSLHVVVTPEGKVYYSTQKIFEGSSQSQGKSLFG